MSLCFRPQLENRLFYKPSTIVVVILEGCIFLVVSKERRNNCTLSINFHFTVDSFMAKKGFADLRDIENVGCVCCVNLATEEGVN